jgi:uncharacterized protein (DUF433 family)
MTLPERTAVDPEITMGKPCVKGTRLPLYLLSPESGGGESEAELWQAYPHLEKKSLVCD